MTKHALISVYDKTDLEKLGKTLHEAGYEILASGGTAIALEESGVPVMRVEEWTGAAEVLDGRVKTLHPKIHAGILADRKKEDHLFSLEKHGYDTIDIVICNLYPFRETLAKFAKRDELIEKIDVGGPTMIRAAAKNVDSGVSVVVDPTDYDTVISHLKNNGVIPLTARKIFAAKAFRLTAEYDLAIAKWAEASAEENTYFPEDLKGFKSRGMLRYGENPHQRACLYTSDSEASGVANGRQIQGKELSYNNYLDLDAAYKATKYPSDDALCAIIKHTNICGYASRKSQLDAFVDALSGDPVSAFGSVIGFNHPVAEETAREIVNRKLFVECMVAPYFSSGALKVLASRKNLRLMEVERREDVVPWHAHKISGGLLVQELDRGIVNPFEWKTVTEKKVEQDWIKELQFAMLSVMNLKSNAIAITRSMMLLGAGTGQMSRIDALNHAFNKIKSNGGHASDVFIASDAFFPFDDCVRRAAERGKVLAVIQPGGSKRDQESIDACNELEIAMVFTGRRHFRH